MRCPSGKQYYGPEDIIIIKKTKMINGKIAVLYFHKDQPDLKRIMIEDKEDYTIEGEVKTILEKHKEQEELNEK